MKASKVCGGKETWGGGEWRWMRFLGGQGRLVHVVLGRISKMLEIWLRRVSVDARSRTEGLIKTYRPSIPAMRR